ncbi:MAG TPA: DNA-processing protein DprA [Armatimonadota bacterium]
MELISKTQFALMLHSIPHLGPKGIARLLKELPHGDEIDLCDVPAWRVPADTLKHDYKLHPEAARCLADLKDEILRSSKEIAESSERLGIRVITIRDPDYPVLLKEYKSEPPPILYAHGNLTLLRDRKFAAVSSSNISAASTEVLREFSSTLADEGLVLVTSHNTHTYQVAGLAARSRNAPVILVLDRGILSAFPHGLGFEPSVHARIWNLRFDPSRDLVVSAFRLYDRWIGANGRERDRMVFGLSDVVVAVEVRAGGVMEKECLTAKDKGREVYVYAPEDNSAAQGNLNLLEKGCPPIPSPSANSLLATLDLLQEPVEGLFNDEPQIL